MANIRIQKKIAPIETAHKELKLIARLTPLQRNMICDDFDKALEILSEHLPLCIVTVPSGTECWTWVIPKKWTVHSAIIKSESGEVVVDANEHALALASYSTPFVGSLTKNELLKHLRWSEKYPDAFVYEFRLGINYQLSDWAFSLPKTRVQALQDGNYHVAVNTEFSDGEMKIGESFLQGKKAETILFISHLCHPGQANDGVSGVGGLARVWAELAKRKNRCYSYLFLIVPETIGSVAWLWSRPEMAKNIVAGINYEMIGVDNPIVLKLSHKHDSVIDRISKKILVEDAKYDIDVRSFRDAYSNDELVFADPDFDIPMISLQHYPFEEYHTSKDDIFTVNEKRLEETHDLTMDILNVFENDFVPKKKYRGPLYLSRYELYVDTTENKDLHRQIWHIMQFLGKGLSVFEIAEDLRMPYETLRQYLLQWEEKGLIELQPSNLLSLDKKTDR